jgi:hypothetical protein
MDAYRPTVYINVNNTFMALVKAGSSTLFLESYPPVGFRSNPNLIQFINQIIIRIGIV